MTSPGDSHGIRPTPDPAAGHVTPAHGHGRHDAAAVEPAYFRAEEWNQFRKSDKGAAAAIAGLMAGIFSIGLIMYTVIAIMVAA
jgi:hypothetical protein